MEDFVKNLAASEEWTQATTTAVLAGVLQDLVDMGSADTADLHALILRRGGADGEGQDEEPSPQVGDEVEFLGHDTQIIVASVPDNQPDANDLMYYIVDQYGETHRVEANTDTPKPWAVIGSGI